jgi:transposase
MIAADELLEHARGKALIGDTGYDSNAFREAIRKKGMKAVIHDKPERLVRHRLARKLYRQRYLVECFFHDLKRYRAIATRYDKTARNFLAVIHVACSLLWLAGI